MKFFYIFNFLFVFTTFLHSQTNYIHSGAEVLNFGSINLSLPNSLEWITDRSKNPGFFSAIGDAKYIGLSNKFNINGYFKKYGNTPFIFPIGNGYILRSLEISKPSLPTDTYATAWIEGDPTFNIDPTDNISFYHDINKVTGSIISVSKVGQWDWLTGASGNLGVNSTGNGNGLLITVSLPDVSNFATSNELRLVGWNGSHWKDLSNKPTASGNIENSKLSGTMIPGISAIAIGKSYPDYKLKSFIVTSLECRTYINWETLFEYNTNNIFLEHSLDSITFKTIYYGTLTGAIKGSKYKFEFEQPQGISYYRLKFINTIGSINYSDIITCFNNCNRIDNIWLYPNPVTSSDNLYIRFNAFNIGNGELILYNNVGLIVMSKSIQYQFGINTFSMIINNLPNGTYYIQLKGTNGKSMGESKKFIKQE